MPFETAVWETSLALALVLLPVRNERHGGSAGPDYVTRAANAASNRARRYLEQHFQIVPKSPEQTGWQLGAGTTLKL